MSYPRNAASPERIAIGAVVQISDGAVQTAGVDVKVIPFGGSEASGTGTVAYSVDGVVLYTPVQAETNYTSFVLVASKAGCIPASTTVVTSANDVAGIVTAELDSTAINAVADAVLTESILDHRNVANSLAKYIWQIRQANLTIDGTVSNAITPTTLTFASNISATTSAYAHAVLLFTTGPLEGENSPIISYTNANGVFLLEEPLTAAPSDGDEFVVIAGSHVHSVADIQDGLARTGADGDTLETLSDQIDGIGGGSGTGARTVTITVNDGTNALQNATVRMTEGANTFTAITNVSGIAVFNLDDATYTVGVTKSGYTFAGTTLVVDGTETATYSMTAITVTPPADPALCAVTIHIRDQYGADLAGQPVEITWVQWDIAADETPPVLSIPPVQTTNLSGEVLVNLYRLAVYKIIYGDGRDARRWDGTIPDAGSYEVAL